MFKSIKTYIIIAVACLLTTACSDQRYFDFVNGSEAHKSITGKQGWVPDWFPAAAKEIQMQYDIDTNCRWFKFKLDKDLKIALIRDFRPVSGEEAKNMKPTAPRNAAWWFEGLIQAEPGNTAALNADIYIRNDTKIREKAYLAVSKTGETVFLWIEK